MHDKSEEWRKQYEALIRTNFERLPSLSLDARTQLREQFADLFKEAEQALGEDPAGAHAQQLAVRCVQLLRTFTATGQPNPTLLKIAAAYLAVTESLADAMPPEPLFGGQRVWEFMGQAIAVRH
jgi:TipAS antibiotic-recognition domain